MAQSTHGMDEEIQTLKTVSVNGSFVRDALDRRSSDKTVGVLLSVSASLPLSRSPREINNLCFHLDHRISPSLSSLSALSLALFFFLSHTRAFPFNIFSPSHKHFYTLDLIQNDLIRLISHFLVTIGWSPQCMWIGASLKFTVPGTTFYRTPLPRAKWVGYALLNIIGPLHQCRLTH